MPAFHCKHRGGSYMVIIPVDVDISNSILTLAAYGDGSVVPRDDGFLFIL